MSRQGAAMGTVNLIRDRFRNWWKREREADFVYDSAYDIATIRYTAEMAYLAGWRAAKREANKR